MRLPAIHERDHVALILDRQEPARHARKAIGDRGNERERHGRRQRAAADHEGDHPRVPVLDPRIGPVERAIENVPPERRNIFYRAFNRAYARIEHWYARVVALMVGRSALTAAVALALIAAIAYGFSRVPSGFLPIEDQGYMIALVNCRKAHRSSAPSRRWTRCSRQPARRRASRR